MWSYLAVHVVFLSIQKQMSSTYKTPRSTSCSLTACNICHVTRPLAHRTLRWWAGDTLDGNKSSIHFPPLCFTERSSLSWRDLCRTIGTPQSDTLATGKPLVCFRRLVFFSTAVRGRQAGKVMRRNHHRKPQIWIQFPRVFTHCLATGHFANANKCTSTIKTAITCRPNEGTDLFDVRKGIICCPVIRALA